MTGEPDSHHLHVNRFADLPEVSRDLLEDEKRVERLMRAADFFQWVETTSRYVKWTAVFVMAVFVTIFALADYISRAVAWLRGG